MQKKIGAEYLNQVRMDAMKEKNNFSCDMNEHT